MTPLLTRHPLAATADPGQMEAILRSAFGVTGFELKSPVSAYHALTNLWRPGDDASLGYVECDADVDITLPGTDAVRLYLGLTGHTSTESKSGAHHLVGPGGFGIVGPDLKSVTGYHAGSRVLVMRIGQPRLRATFRALTGRHVEGEFEFQSDRIAEHPGATRALQELVYALAAQADNSSCSAVRLLDSALLQIVVTALLTVVPHNWSHALQASAPALGRSRIQRAEAFIEAHWNEPLSAQRIAEHVDCSERTLFKSFQATHGIGPIVFLRKVRLEQARQLLSGPESGVSVAQAAARCGFTNLGHFARYYREQFGILPSETLRSAKSRN